MLEYSQLNVPGTSRVMLSTFGGYNHNIKIKDSEFYDMKNMTSKFYPVLSPREQRAIGTKNITNPNGLIAKDALAYEKSDSEAAKTYVNVIAVKEGNEESEPIKALIEVLKSDEIKNYINETYDGAVIPFEESEDAEDAAETEEVTEETAEEAETEDAAAEETAEEDAE